MSLQQLIQDFEKRYNRTWVWVRFAENGPEYICFIDNVQYDESLDDGLIFLTNSKFGQMQIKYKASGAELDFRWPQTGYFQYKNCAIYAHRGHDRQWKRGICKGNFTVSSVFSSVAPFQLFARSSLTEDVLLALELSHPISLSEAMARLQNGDLAVAVNRDFAVALSHLKRYERILWFRNSPVASIEGDSVTLLNQMWKQELQDFLRDCGGEFWLR